MMASRPRAATLHRVILTGILAASLAFAPGTLPVHASPAATAYAIEGAKIYTLAGAPIEDGIVVIRDGKIAAVGAKVAVPSDAAVIDARGLEVYPGLFDPVTQIGLREIGSVSGSVDTSELGEFDADLSAITAVNPASAHIAVARASGITEAVDAPGIAGFDGSGSSAIIPGKASAIHLSGWTNDELLLRSPVAMVLNWPTLQTQSFDFETFTFKTKPFTDVKKEYDRQVNELSDYLDKARHYAQAQEKGSAKNFERDLKLEALVPVVEGKLPVLVIAQSARDIRNSVEFCIKQRLKMILAGASEAWKEKEALKKNNIPVILGPTLRLPDEENYPYDEPMTQPSELAAAGIPIAFASFDSSFSRRLSQQAGNAVAYGLSHDEALRAVTVNAAKMFGLDSEIGSIEVGKTANLIITDGDPLEIRTRLRYSIIKGQPASLDNRHLQLYEQYRKRPAPSVHP